MASIHNNAQLALRVPGGSIAYQVRGNGPLLLMIAGDDGGAAGYDAFADTLAGQYTIVTYDRRGAYRSTLDNPADDVSLKNHSDDAHRLLDTLADGPAYVFGSSAGALVGLDLAIRYPRQVRLLIAHEPPVEGILPTFDQFQQEVFETYQREGGLAAIKYTLPAVHRYRLDIAALAAAPVRVVLAVGSAGRQTLGYACTTALAERLGTPVVEFPSHHAGYVSHPRAFAQKLSEVLGEAPVAG